MLIREICNWRSGDSSLGLNGEPAICLECVRVVAAFVPGVGLQTAWSRLPGLFPGRGLPLGKLLADCVGPRIFDLFTNL